MSYVLYLTCSPFGTDTLGTHLFHKTIAEFNGCPEILYRNLATSPLMPISAEHAKQLAQGEEKDRTEWNLSDELITEVEQSTGLIISTPIHNFTVPAALKLWLDYVVRKNRTFELREGQKRSLLADRPVLVIVRSACSLDRATSTQEDYLTPYLTRILSVMGLCQVTTVFLHGPSPNTAICLSVQIALQDFFHRLSLRNSPCKHNA